LLGETGKLFEQVITGHLTQHLSRGKNPLQRLSPDQYGFRERLSTVDAILRVKSLSESYTKEGGVALAVLLDIVNAFNSLPWDRIGEAIQHFGFTDYLCETVWDYFRDRTLSYADRAEIQQRRGVYCGVLQGSVVGPLLWDIGYDAVLRAGLPPGSRRHVSADPGE
jgi:hypothetical protein